MTRVVLKFTEDTSIPFQADAQPDLPAALLAQWTALTNQFGFLSLTPAVSDVSAADLQSAINDARNVSPGDSVPNPMLCFVITVPDDALPDPDTVATNLVDGLSALPFIEFALIEGVLNAAVNRLDNPDALFQKYLNPAPVGVNAETAWATQGGDGTGINVGVLETFDYDRAHRDMPTRRLDLTPQLGVPGDIDIEHATAIMGIIGAADNMLDCVGIAPEATFVFASGQDRNNTGALVIVEGFNLLNLLGIQLTGGGVLNISADAVITLPSGKTHVPIEQDPLIRTALRLLTFRGITVVVAAGNGRLNLDTAGINPPDSGAVIVGGVTPTNPQATMFAPHALTNSGNRVDCCAWASEVVTLATPIGGVFVQTFSGNGGGTSLATAIVSGVVAALQGHARAKNGSTLTPAQIRGLLRDPTLGTAVAPGAGLGSMPDLAKLIPNI